MGDLGRIKHIDAYVLFSPLVDPLFRPHYGNPHEFFLHVISTLFVSLRGHNVHVGTSSCLPITVCPLEKYIGHCQTGKQKNQVNK